MFSMECDGENIESEPTLRTQDEVSNLFKCAKLDQDEHSPLIQSLYFSNNLEVEDNLQLLEVDSQLFDYICKGGKITFCGDEDECAVLRTDSKTYEVKSALTSNSLLVPSTLLIPSEVEEIDHSITQHQISTVYFNYWELKQCQPRNGKLYRTLSGKLHKTGSDDFGYTWDDLLDRIQASEGEMKAGLKRMKAYLIEGRWCLFDFDDHFRILSYFLNYIDSESLPLNRICRREVFAALGGLEAVPVLEQCFDYFFRTLSSEHDDGCYEMRELDVSRFCAEALLKPVDKFNLEEFLSLWQNSVPEGLITRLSHLNGLALIDEDRSVPFIRYFPVTDLPPDLPDAISMLFEKRPKWTFEQILPYLLEFIFEDHVGAVLARYTRSSFIDGAKYFSLRHAN